MTFNIKTDMNDMNIFGSDMNDMNIIGSVNYLNFSFFCIKRIKKVSNKCWKYVNI